MDRQAGPKESTVPRLGVLVIGRYVVWSWLVSNAMAEETHGYCEAVPDRFDVRPDSHENYFSIAKRSMRRRRGSMSAQS